MNFKQAEMHEKIPPRYGIKINYNRLTAEQRYQINPLCSQFIREL